jgi:transposase-like protein
MGRLRNIEELFAGQHFDREVILLCVRWYLRYKLSFRDLVEMMAERGTPACPYDDPALGSTVYARVHQAVESLWPLHWPLVASR